jgi:peptidylprolyl isomerase
MNLNLQRSLTAFLSCFLAMVVFMTSPSAADPENTLFLDLEDGRVVIEMRPDLAPNHVTRVKELVREGFYDGLLFHRVIAGFMAQTGDPRGDGTGGSGVNLKAEFTDEPHGRGTVSMARGGSPDSADSQFFIVYARSEWLDGKYTVWGKVTDGMVHVGRIKRGDKARNGSVVEPDHIVRMRVAADVKE